MQAQGVATGWLAGTSTDCRPGGVPPSRPWRMVLLGPPGVGKGTQAALIEAAIDACHLSTGDLFRAAAASHVAPSPAMQAALAGIARGELASDVMVIALLRERVHCLTCPHGFLLDGFPRTAPQATVLEALLDEASVALDGAVYLQAPDAVIIERLSGRRVCRTCRRSHHLDHHPPRRAGCCDACGGQLYQRDDDVPAAIAVRLAHYARTTPALLAFYQQRGLLRTVDATGTPHDVLARVETTIGWRLGVQPPVTPARHPAQDA